MKLKTILLTVLLSTSLIGTAYADINDGYKAYYAKDYATAHKEWKPLAEQGHAVAQYNLGVMYDRGYGVLKDYKEAVNWYRKAAKQGHSSGQYNLGVLYAKGAGVLKDMTKAKYWIKKAYEGDDAETSKLAKENWDIFELWKY